MKNQAGVMILDSNCVNPYGPELASILARKMPATLLAARDTWMKPDVPCLGLRASRRTDRVGVIVELFSMVTMTWRILRGSRVVIVWARTSHKVLLGVIGALVRGRVYYVMHNPVASRSPSGWRARVEDLLIRRATSVVHSEQLAASLVRSWPDARATTVLHPAYNAYWARAPHGDRPVRSETPRLLLLGALRPDKLSRRDVDTILTRLAETGRPYEVRLCCRPRLDVGPQIGPLNVVNDSSESIIPDEVILEALADADVLLAPYVDPTDSGTIRLALTAGLRVVAYKAGVYAELLPQEDLATPGDIDDFVSRVTKSSTGNPGTQAVNASDEQVAAAWMRVLS